MGVLRSIFTYGGNYYGAINPTFYLTPVINDLRYPLIVQKMGPDVTPGPSFPGPADEPGPVAPSLAPKGGHNRAFPPTGR